VKRIQLPFVMSKLFCVY